MITVTFKHDYSCPPRGLGFEAGQVAELSEDVVAFIERDSPGCVERRVKAVDAPAVDKAVKAAKVDKSVG